MNNGQGDAGSPTGKIHNFCFGDKGVFIVTGKEAEEREPGKNYGLGPLPPATEPPKTVVDNLKGARDAIIYYGPEWQVALREAIIEVRGDGPATSPCIDEARDIEPWVNAVLTEGRYPQRPGQNEPEAYLPASVRQISGKLKLFG